MGFARNISAKVALGNPLFRKGNNGILKASPHNTICVRIASSRVRTEVHLPALDLPENNDPFSPFAKGRAFFHVVNAPLWSRLFPESTLSHRITRVEQLVCVHNREHALTDANNKRCPLTVVAAVRMVSLAPPVVQRHPLREDGDGYLPNAQGTLFALGGYQQTQP